jgi:Rps23 Pro-64 3,4-dihydroxylase Tpa1-like proline 4-hydroxylase
MQSWQHLGAHRAMVSDDFAPAAEEVRRELLRYPTWRPMTQRTSVDGQIVSRVQATNQSGITTGHLIDSPPASIHFASELHKRAGDLAQTMGVPLPSDLHVELNGMAYGHGSRLRVHTDHALGTKRRIAWILYLVAEREPWTVSDGGALRLRAEPNVDVYPKLGRVVAFAVSETSAHEILPVLRETSWESCRLALSGWITEGPRVMRPPSDTLPAELVTTYEETNGRVAMFELLLAQRRACGLDEREAASLLEQARRR